MAGTENKKKIIAFAGLVAFGMFVSKASDYLIEMVPPPQLAPIDLFSFLHAFTTAGFAFFAVILAGKKGKMKKYILMGTIFLVLAWEVVENTILAGTPLAGGESLLNSGADIVIGILMSGSVLYGDRIGLKKNDMRHPRSNFS